MDEYDSPLLGALENQMKCGIRTNASGRITLVHEHVLKGAVEWVEYDPSLNTVSIVYEGGFIQDLGIVPNTETKKNLLNTNGEVTLIRAKNDKAYSMRKTLFMIKDY